MSSCCFCGASVPTLSPQEIGFNFFGRFFFGGEGGGTFFFQNYTEPYFRMKIQIHDLQRFRLWWDVHKQ